MLYFKLTLNCKLGPKLKDRLQGKGVIYSLEKGGGGLIYHFFRSFLAWKSFNVVLACHKNLARECNLVGLFY